MSNVVRDSLVSIVVTIYNQEKYLEFCLQTILNQTYKNLQIICVNDGSTDSSSRILDMMAQKDERLQVIHQENAGAGKARNEGFKHVTGDYVLFLDGDDFFQPTMVEVALEKALSD
ncbi:MAG: glycosyltransferase, partial [Veillonella sp.]|nr:glycosyltransferase [Veillonella sp.]